MRAQQRNTHELFLFVDPFALLVAGKTLSARAVANRTDACFIRVIGSELVQKYVGEGARMVRELFTMGTFFYRDVRAACT
jgi:AAA+ superfamily predicted ATPase